LRGRAAQTAFMTGAAQGQGERVSIAEIGHAVKLK
jgi:hypothetical protein